VIGQAKGILMARYGVSADRAFEDLRRASQGNGRKLRDVAEEVVGSISLGRVS
jgi:AmiR/NasT family two-component response regulator